MNRFMLIFAAMLMLPLMLTAQDSDQKPCSAPEAAQFDFWVGEWDLSWPAGQGGSSADQPGKGTNSIRKILGTCVVEENFSNEQGSYLGRSWSVYNATQKEWRQTWVDNSAGYLLFTGGMTEAGMELRTKPVERDGQTFISRMVFRNVSENSFDWYWQRSADNGQTWNNVWVIHYQRRQS